MAATPPAKRKPSSAAAPAVATWVRVELNKKVKRNQFLQNVPAVVSRVNAEEKTVNLLYPNKLSVFFHDLGQCSILFAIETHPMAKVLPWEGPTAHLDKILVHALLHFAEARAPAFKGNKQLSAVAGEIPEFMLLDARGKAVDGNSQRIDQIKIDLKNIELDNDGAVLGSTRAVGSASAGETPSRASGPQAGALDDGETPPKLVAPTKPERNELPEFMKRVVELFRRLERDAIPKQEIRAELAVDFPDWERFLVKLESQNKVITAEDAVMLIQ